MPATVPWASQVTPGTPEAGLERDYWLAWNLFLSAQMTPSEPATGFFKVALCLLPATAGWLLLRILPWARSVAVGVGHGFHGGRPGTKFPTYFNSMIIVSASTLTLACFFLADAPRRPEANIRACICSPCGRADRGTAHRPWRCNLSSPATHLEQSCGGGRNLSRLAVAPISFLLTCFRKMSSGHSPPKNTEELPSPARGP